MSGAPSGAPCGPPAWLRSAVREVLVQSPGFRGLPGEKQRQLAHAMVNISAMAANLIEEEHKAQARIDAEPVPALALALNEPNARKPGLASAQSAEPAFGESANRVADVTRNVLGAVSFPRFVTDLINGVFKAMISSNTQQMQSYMDLLGNISASAEGFAKTQFGEMQVRQWLVDRFPDHFELEQPDADDASEPPDEDAEPPRLRLRSGKNMPSPEELRAGLTLPATESVDAGNPERLVPVAQRQLARQRQQMLSTMVQMGMQRIVIESGRINAAMRFHVDTRSAANSDRGSSFGMQNRVRAAGSFGVGPWGASAEVENTISYVSTERSQRSEEINTDLTLNSSVELNFKSDYLPLNRMAGREQAAQIRANSLNPEAEAAADRADRNTRQAAQRASEDARRTATDTRLAQGATPPPLSNTPLAVPRSSTAAGGAGGGDTAAAPVAGGGTTH